MSGNEQKSEIVETTDEQFELPPNRDEMKIRLLQRQREQLIHGAATQTLKVKLPVTMIWERN